MNISSYREFPVDQIIFENPIRSKDNTYISEAVLRNNDGENEKIIIQTPGLLNINGIVRTGNRAHIELAIDKEHSDFYDFITNIDRNAMDVIEKNSETWFGQKFPRQIIEDFYRSVLKPGREQTTPCVKLNLPVDGDKILVDFLNKDKKKCFYSEIPSNTKTVVAMQFIGLRFLKQQVLSMWKPIQVLVKDTILEKEPNMYIRDNLLSDEESIEDIELIEALEIGTDVNILEEAPKEENTTLSISENMERPDNSPNYEEVTNLLEHTEVIQSGEQQSGEQQSGEQQSGEQQSGEQQLLESLDLELDEVPMEDESLSGPVPQEQNVYEEEEVPTLTDNILDTLEVES
jgi:hypothetical protein